MTDYAQLHSAWTDYIREFGTSETFTLLQLEQAMRLALDQREVE
jgi:hypothetical protein